MPRRPKTHSPPRLGAPSHNVRVPEKRGTAAQRGYDRQWRKLRAKKLRANPLCEPCEDDSRVTTADTVDHITPIEERPDLRLVWDNLRSMCRDCHEVRHGRKRRGDAVETEWDARGKSGQGAGRILTG